MDANSEQLIKCKEELQISKRENQRLEKKIADLIVENSRLRMESATQSKDIVLIRSYGKQVSAASNRIQSVLRELLPTLAPSNEIIAAMNKSTIETTQRQTEPSNRLENRDEQNVAEKTVEQSTFLIDSSRKSSEDDASGESSTNIISGEAKPNVQSSEINYGNFMHKFGIIHFKVSPFFFLINRKNIENFSSSLDAQIDSSQENGPAVENTPTEPNIPTDENPIEESDNANDVTDINHTQNNTSEAKGIEESFVMQNDGNIYTPTIFTDI